jgi:transcriptional regulator
MNQRIVDHVWKANKGLSKSEIANEMKTQSSLFSNLEKDLNELVELALLRKEGGLYFSDLPF